MASADWAVAWWAWCVPSALQATFLLALAWTADRFLVRRAWPELLSLFWLLALVRFFLPPDLRSPLSVTAGLGAPAIAVADSAPSVSRSAAFFCAGLAGALCVVAVRALRRARLVSRFELVTPSRAWQSALERSARLVGARRTPRIAVLDDLTTPAVLGTLRPTLLLPRAW
ncbi:MAG TPA: hypothetical protein VM509_07310, partial [Planctomycetota bacterium]|nr:hypothetical protein [Planctomycetota bacterium]